LIELEANACENSCLQSVCWCCDIDTFSWVVHEPGGPYQALASRERAGGQDQPSHGSFGISAMDLKKVLDQTVREL